MKELETLVRAAQVLSRRFDIAVIGGVSLGAWTEPRTTNDVDILIDSDDFDAIESAGNAAGLVTNPDELATLRRSGMTRLRLPQFPTGRVRMDVIIVDHPYYDRVVQRAVQAPIYGSSVPVATAEDIVILKTLADRAQDRADVASILKTQGDRLDRQLIEKECAAIGIDPPW